MKLKLSFVLFIICSLTVNLNAQEKSSNSDLRVKRSIFYIKVMSDKEKGTHYKLLTTVGGQFNFEITKDNKVISSFKVANVDAVAIDELFVDNFISFKYLMKTKAKSKCSEKYYLNLRGEDQVICQKEDVKIKKLEQFISELKSKFS
jgi:hypothetical protein